MTDPVLVRFAIYAIVVLAAVAALYRRSKAMRAVLDTPESSTQCAACESRSVTVTGVDCYRCDACGHEGGAGQEQARWDQFRARVAGLSPVDRQRSGAQSLESARLALLGVVGTLDRQLEAGRAEFRSRDAREDQAARIEEVEREFNAAKRSVAEASEYFDDDDLRTLSRMGVTQEGGGPQRLGEWEQAKHNAELMMETIEHVLDRRKGAATYRGG